MQRPWVRTAVIFAALAIFCCGIARHRLIDADEGYILYAARLVASGRRPYADFFFPQPPLLPYVLGAVVRPMTWLGGRMACGLLMATTGTLVVLGVRRHGVPAWSEFLAAAVFATTALAFGWLPIAKTYALAAPLLYGAHLVATSPHDTSRRAPTVGLLFGLSVLARLYLLALAPVFGAIVVFRARRRAAAALGFVVGLVPPALLFLFIAWRGRAALAFDLVEYHRGIERLIGGYTLAQRFEVIRQLFGAAATDRALGVQFALLTMFAVVAAARSLPRARATALVAIALALLTVMPTPIYVQYFCLLTPLVVELAVCGLVSVRPPIVFAFAAAHASLGVVEIRRHCLTGRALIGVDEAWRWRIDTVREAGRLVADYARCAPLAVTWPGYAVESSVPVWPGMENHFGKTAGYELPSEDARRTVHVLSTNDLDLLAGGRSGPRPAIWLVGNWANDDDWKRLQGYSAVVARAGATLFVVDCPSTPFR